MKWRPEGWHTEEVKGNPLHCLAPQECADHFFEAGAAAMLEALRKEGVHFKVGQWTDDATFKTNEPGTEVFIPDDK